MSNRTRKAPSPEYLALKAFFAFYTERYANLENLPPDKRPIACLEVLEKMGMSMATRGLRQAINDSVEESLRFDRKEVEKFDSELRSRGIVTLSEVRRRYSRAYARIKKRASIKTIRSIISFATCWTIPPRKPPMSGPCLKEWLSNMKASRYGLQVL